MAFNDVFPLEDAAELTCSIDKYAVGHSALWVRIMRNGLLVCYLYFTNVKYISAPMLWKSADFHMAPDEDCRQLLIKMGYPEKLAIEYTTDDLKLYVVEKPDITIQILAKGIEKIDYDILSLRNPSE